MDTALNAPKDRHVTHPFESSAHVDRDLTRATWMIGVVSALVLGMTIGVAVGDAARPAACGPREGAVATPTGQ